MFIKAQTTCASEDFFFLTAKGRFCDNLIIELDLLECNKDYQFENIWGETKFVFFLFFAANLPSLILLTFIHLGSSENKNTSKNVTSAYIRVNRVA